MTDSPSQQAKPALRLMPLITGHWVAAAVYAAARLKLADHLKGGPRTAEDLALACGAHGPSVNRVMRALTRVGLFEEVGAERYALTELSDLLRADHPESMRPMVLFQGAPPHWQGWGNFLYAVQTGQPAFENVHGKPFFDYLGDDPEFAEHFNQAMTAMSAIAADAVADAYDFSGIRRLVDVGGGHGHLLSRILERFPKVRGTLFDLPNVVEGAKPALRKAGLLERCDVAGGSFFESVPAGDAYIAKNIIHDWDDDHARTILKNMRTAMDGRGKVLLVELVIVPKDKELNAVMIDLEMLHATHGGRERTEDEFARLFESAGLKLNRLIPTKSPFRVLEAVPSDSGGGR